MMDWNVKATFDARQGTPVTDVRFIHSRSSAARLMTISKRIWSVITIWEIQEERGPVAKLYEWSERGCLVHTYALYENAVNAHSAPGDVTPFMAVSVVNPGGTSIKILALDATSGLHVVKTIASKMEPVLFQDNLLVLCDDTHTSVLVDWRTEARALLRRDEEPAGFTSVGGAIQAVLLDMYIIIVCARCVLLFERPPVVPPVAVPSGPHSPLADFSFGWVDNMSVCETVAAEDPKSLAPLYVMLRAAPDDPWAALDDYHLDVYTLLPSLEADGPDPLPYRFPPRHTARIRSTRGSLQCTALRVGRFGTSIWIQPRDRSVSGLAYAMQEEIHEYAPIVRKDERVMCSVLPGPLFSGGVDENDEVPEIRAFEIWANEANDCKAIDYDEDLGLVAVGTTRGSVVILSAY
ncbi:unnamed protein product [Mycena citricolor]|uniref:Uncharacterized protein n=1 Tax=Mycena citricolor TaxID=2018698 RepID=A0AAD2K3M8_9AGAR|nr:unnamed protein product [Mycena citricolor]